MARAVTDIEQDIRGLSREEKVYLIASGPLVLNRLRSKLSG